MAEMIERMKELGASQEAVDFMLSSMGYGLRDMSRLVTRDMRDARRDRKRDQDRERQRRRREKLKQLRLIAEANDAAKERDDLRDAKRDGASSHCTLLTPLSSDSESKKNSRKGRIPEKEGDTRARARGTRLPEGWQPSEADRRFALDHGVDPDWLRGEFIDFWTSVPGQRGTKLNWSATWRNRVRSVGVRGKPNGYRNGSPQRTDLQLALDKAREFASRGDPPEPAFPEDESSERY